VNRSRGRWWPTAREQGLGWKQRTRVSELAAHVGPAAVSAQAADQPIVRPGPQRPGAQARIGPFLGLAPRMGAIDRTFGSVYRAFESPTESVLPASRRGRSQVSTGRFVRCSSEGYGTPVLRRPASPRGLPIGLQRPDASREGATVLAEGHRIFRSGLFSRSVPVDVGATTETPDLTLTDPEPLELCKSANHSRFSNTSWRSYRLSACANSSSAARSLSDSNIGPPLRFHSLGFGGAGTRFPSTRASAHN
jgi:hypothetical protein